MTKPGRLLKTLSTTDRGMTPEQSDQRDQAFPHTDTLTMRLTRGLRAGITTRSLTENRPESAIVRRWLRNGAAAEGIDIQLW